MKEFKQNVCSLLVMAMLLGMMSMGISLPASAASSFTEVSGWFESLYATISGVSDADVTAVSYSGTASGSLTGDALEYLVRDVSGGVRIDIPGLAAGTYDLTVTTTGGVYTQTGIKVTAYDRSGYAHWNYSQGVGAYKNDGTLKDNAIVLYVTDENKDTVTVSAKDGTTVTGIGNILNSGGGQYKIDSTTGLPIEHALNTNQQILRRLAEEGTPLVVRIIGNVTAPTGLTAYDSTDYGGSVGDNGFMARMQSGMNITIEGVGDDSVINGWGLHFIAQEAYPNYGKSFEVRNLEFRNVPEDCVGMEGVRSGTTFTAAVERCWVHNCSFYGPTIKNPAEGDKNGGDGAVDFKRGQYYTMSYCYFEGYHKTNLVGAKDSDIQYHMTWHHNYWKDCEARAPLARQANIHIYNNVFEGQSKYCMSLRANCYIYSEYNTFIDCKVTDSHNNGDAKCYKNTYTNCTNMTNTALHEVTDKATTIDSKCLYENFDTNSAYGYVADGNYALQANAATAYDTVLAYAGPMKASATTPDIDYTPESETVPTEPVPTGPSVTYIHNFTKDGKESSFYTITGDLSTSKGKVSYEGLSLTQCLVMSSTSASVSFTAPYSGTLVMVFGGSTSDKNNTVLVDGNGRTIDSNNLLTVSLSEGEHTVIKSDTVHLWYIAFTTDGQPLETEPTEEPTAAPSSEPTEPPTSEPTAEPTEESTEPHTHSYSAKVTNAATCTAAGIRTYTCSCGSSYTETIPATGHSYKTAVTAPSCTAQGYTTHTCTTCGSSYKDSYTAATGHSYVNGVCSLCGRSETVSSSILEAAGHLESAYVEWALISGADGYNVYVKKSGGSYTQLDTELIRQYPDRMRADALGLAAGSYVLKVVPIVDGAEATSAAMESDTLTVLAHDRGGFAHSGGYNVGAYNADGTLAKGAVVVYVTEENKNTVSANIPGRGTATGLQNIVSAAEDATVPVCIRIIGELGIPSKTSSGQIRIEGNAQAVTVEGVGEDATCNGWGFVLSECENVEIRNLGFMNNASSEGDSITLEDVTHAWVHNNDFFYGTDRGGDKVKGDGALDTKASRYITHSYNHFWDCGKVNLQGSSSGDSSNYISYHHNWYDHSDSRHPRVRNASVHVYNNYYDGNSGYGIGAACDADVFAENNYFRNCDYPMLTSAQGSDTSKTMSGEPGGMIKAYGNVIVGETSFIPYTSGSTSFDAYVASSRDEQVPSSVAATNGGATYNNFDTASSFYSYTVDTAQAGAEKTVAYAGRVGGGDFQWEFNDAVDDETSAVNTQLRAALEAYETNLVSIGGNSVITDPEPTDPDPTDPTDPDPTDPVVTEPTDPVVTEPTDPVVTEPTEAPTQPTVPGNVASQYIHDFTANGLESDFYTITGELSTAKGTVSYDGKTLTRCLKLDKSTSNVTFDAPYSGTLTMIFGGSTSDRNKKVLINGTGYTIDTNSHLTVEIEAGSHTVTRSSSSVNLWYVVYTPDIPEAPVVEPFSVAGVNLALNNDITLYLYLMAENYDPSYTMEITKSYADGREVTKTVAAADWENYYGTMYRVGFNGIAAKEMTDEITVTVYDASGNAVSKEFVTTVADAAVLVYKSEANARSFTMMADLLNYGAAAQGNFRYNTDDLANTRLTAEQAAYASARFDMSTVTGKASGTAGAMGATLYLDTNIQHNFIFDAAVVDSTMTAKVSYTNYKGVANSFTIPGSRFVNNGSMITVNVSALTPADVNVPVTVQIVDANGAAVCSLTDSIAWYCVRAQASATNDLFIELMEFATSCNAYFG